MIVQEGTRVDNEYAMFILFKLLDDAIAQGMAFCDGLGIDLASLLKSKDVFKNVGTFDEYADKFLK